MVDESQISQIVQTLTEYNWVKNDTSNSWYKKGEYQIMTGTMGGVKEPTESKLTVYSRPQDAFLRSPYFETALEAAEDAKRVGLPIINGVIEDEDEIEKPWFWIKYEPTVEDIALI